MKDELVVLVKFVKDIKDKFNTTRIKRADLLSFGAENNIDKRLIFKYLCKPVYRTSQRGEYDLRDFLNSNKGSKETPLKKEINLATNVHELSESSYVPKIDSSYIKWGNHSTIKKIVQSKQFFPIYVSGLSGNGKSFMIQQICALTNRKYIRVNLSPETDEDDLIGGYRLENGNTVFSKGPVIRAMEEGAVLLLDEIDRASNKIMCLQSVLEGNSVLLKKTCETIHPSYGFTIIATANTDGRGDESGRYMGATIIDDAFLERFPITIKQEFPTRSIEYKILTNSMNKYDVVNDDFVNKLCDWSQIIRKTYDMNGIDDVISTRRLDHIAKTYAILQSREKSIDLVINRFPKETGLAFKELYKKIDTEIEEGKEDVEEPELDIMMKF